MRTSQRIAALVIALCGGGTHAVHADVIADLRGDYDTPSSPHTNGQSAAGRIPDAFGTGNWTFFASATAAPGDESALIYTTTANGIRNANCYALSGQFVDLPALNNTQVTAGDGNGFAASDELALHPGITDAPQPYVVFRWTAGIGETGLVNLAGSLRDLEVVFNGLTLDIYNSAGSSLFGPAITSGNSATTFNIDTTIATGGFIDFVVGHNGNWSSDHAAFKATISAIPEPTALTGVAASAAMFLTRRKRRLSRG